MRGEGRGEGLDFPVLALSSGFRHLGNLASLFSRPVFSVDSILSSFISSLLAAKNVRVSRGGGGSEKGGRGLLALGKARLP